MTAPDAVEPPPDGARDVSATAGLAAVQEALADRQGVTGEALDAAPDRGQPVARGDVRVVEPLSWIDGRYRLAVVRGIDAEHDIADMMLTHPWPELATETDAVIASCDAGLPHPLVVECYVRGPVWLLQVGERFGFLPESILQAIGAAVVDDQPEVEGARAGLPLAGPADPRWRFKEDEVIEWSALTEDCASALLQGDDPWQPEPERLHPETYRESSDPATPSRGRLRLEETVHFVTTRNDVRIRLEMLDPEALNRDRWIECLGPDFGPTAFSAIQQILLDALSRAGTKVLQEAG